MNPQPKFVWELISKLQKKCLQVSSLVKPFVLAFMLEYNPNIYVNTVLSRPFSPPTEKWEVNKPTPPPVRLQYNSCTVAIFPPCNRMIFTS